MSPLSFLLLLLLGVSNVEPRRQRPLFMLDLFEYPLYCEEIYLTSPTVTIVSFHRIAKALRASGYRLMPNVLAGSLNRLVAYCSDGLFFFVDRQNRFTLYSNTTASPAITLFVPSDEAMRFEPWIGLDAQILPAKWEKEDFFAATSSPSPSFSEGPGIGVCDRYKNCSIYYRFNRLVPIENPNGTHGEVFIGGARVTKWNIYNDGHVIVHGTDDFFNHTIDWPVERHFEFQINTDGFEVP